MKKCTIICLWSLLLIGLFSKSFSADNRKLAQTGMKFLSVSTDARAGGLSNALTAREWGASSMFYNPAGMANVKNFMNASFGQLTWIADINYKYGSVAFSPENGAYGVFGLTFFTVDYGAFLGTIRAQNEQGYLDTGEFSPNSFSFGFGYAKSLTDKFSIGAHIKYVEQNLTGGIINYGNDESTKSKSFSADVIAFDFGILYKTGFKSLTFGMSVRNFAQEIEFQSEPFQLPLAFEMGLSMNVFDLIDMDGEKHSLVASVDATHPRDFEEQIDIGFEYKFIQTFSLRLGYTSPIDEQGLSYGAGFYKEFGEYSVGIDYAYTPFGVFNEVQRFTVNFGL